MTKPRITDIIGYSAETSAPNEEARWGYFTAAWGEVAQEWFEQWLEKHIEGVKVESHQEGYRTACGDIESGAFISGDPWRVSEIIRTRVLTEVLNYLPTREEDARSGMLSARKKVAELFNGRNEWAG